MSRLFKNNAATTLNANLAASAAAQTVTILNGSAFPTIAGTDTFFVTLEKVPTTGVIEILEVTAHSAGGTSLTVNRGQDGTAIVAWLTGDLIEMRVVAKEYEEFVAETDAAVALQGTLSVAGATTLSTPLPVASGGTGVASHTSGAVLTGNAGGALGYVEPGVANDVLATQDGTSWASVPVDTFFTQARVLAALTDPLPVNEGGTGLATLTANALLVGAGTSDVTFIAPSTSGNVLTSNGTTWASTAPAGEPARGREIFYTSDTFTVPATVTKVWVSGSGGCGDDTRISCKYLDAAAGDVPLGLGAGEGFGAETVTRRPVTVTPAQVVAVTIGLGGNPAVAATDTVFGAFVTIAGGNTVFDKITTHVSPFGGMIGTADPIDLPAANSGTYFNTAAEIALYISRGNKFPDGWLVVEWGVE